MTLEEFKKDIEWGIEDFPKNWNIGKKVYAYIDHEYRVAKDVQFKDEVDCCNDDSKVEEFILKAFERVK